MALGPFKSIGTRVDVAQIQCRWPRKLFVYQLMDLGDTNLSANIVLTSSLLRSYTEVGYHYLVILDVLFKIN